MSLQARLLAATEEGLRQRGHEGRSGVRPAAAGCRFPPASLLALHRSECRAPVHGQQAALRGGR